MSASLYTCPRCARTGFYFTGLQQHVCRGSKPDDERRRLNLEEIAHAERQVAPVPAIETIPVNVRLGAAVNIARASSGARSKLASATSDGRTAALRAAAKYFACREVDVKLTLLEQGDLCANKPARYMAERRAS